MAKILIVDDEPFNLDYLEQELEDSPYEIILAGNGQEALQKVRGEPPDLVLLDIMMPVMDGFEVLRRLKGDPATRDIPVIVISASNSLQSVVKGIELGAEDYLPKPFEPALLHARIASSMEKKRLHDLERLYVEGLERELQIGRDIQRSFLPAEIPGAEGWQVSVYFKAAREVAGDFYDAFMLPDGDLVCVVGDVCGKGVGAALFMTLFRSLIRATATTTLAGGPTLPQPSSAAERLLRTVSFTNHYIADTHGDANMFATLFVAICNSAKGNVTYVNCGNEPPLLLRHDGSLTRLPPTGPAVGIIDGAEFRAEAVAMEGGDLLLAFTDGIPDALNGENDCFGYERLRDLLASARGSSTLIVRTIAQELVEFTGEAEQFDDITLLAVERK